MLFADQGSDLLFVGNSMTSGNATLVVTGSAGLFFILVFSLSAGLKAFGEKRSVWEFFLALFGIDIGLRCDKCRSYDCQSLMISVQCHSSFWCKGPFPASTNAAWHGLPAPMT